MQPDWEIGACAVAEVMGTELFTLSPDTAVTAARRLVLENDIDHLLVLDNGTLTGIICSDDLQSADREGCVGDFMTSPVVCITPETTLQEAMDIMGANDIGCLPVVNGTSLVGIVTWEGLTCADLTPRALDEHPENLGAHAGADRGRNPPRRRHLAGPGEACAVCGRPDTTTAVRSLARLALCARCRCLQPRGHLLALG